MYNFDIIKEMQNELDQKIIIKHGLTEVQTFNSRILSLMVELGELANETRCFKYWSLKLPSEREVILEEYVDGIHFIVSLGNTLEVDLTEDMFKRHNYDDLTKQFLELYLEISKLTSNITSKHYKNVFNLYINLGYSLGFSLEDVFNAYLKKNKINHKRQASNY